MNPFHVVGVDVLDPFISGQLLLVGTFKDPLKEGVFVDQVVLIDSVPLPLFQLDVGGRVQELPIVCEPHSLVRASETHSDGVPVVDLELVVVHEDPVDFYQAILPDADPHMANLATELHSPLVLL